MAVAPEQFPPPVDPIREFIGPPTDPEDERIEVGVAIVGGGPAGLACAIRIMQLLETDPELAERLGEVPVAVIEKGKITGAHLLSGANMRPSAMRELFPDLDPSEWPVYQEVTKDAVYLLTKRRALPLKPMPPNFRNHGNYVTSIAKLGRFLGEKAEEAGVYVLAETAADRLLVEDRIVKGVRSGDKGRGRDGEELSNFEPGSDVIAKATVLAEGTLGHLTMAALDYYGLHGRDPQRWELGVKEVWKVPRPLDRVIHTMGWPLRKRARWNEFGGSFIYPMGEDHVCIGLVVGLDYTDATF
jgi:electron-transferring-flavoprotein dehydrogenase